MGADDADVGTELHSVIDPRLGSADALTLTTADYAVMIIGLDRGVPVDELQVACAATSHPHPHPNPTTLTLTTLMTQTLTLTAASLSTVCAGGLKPRPHRPRLRIGSDRPHRDGSGRR
jgi:hypothetical protein